jgi:hypothetical protein
MHAKAVHVGLDAIRLARDQLFTTMSWFRICRLMNR